MRTNNRRTSVQSRIAKNERRKNDFIPLDLSTADADTVTTQLTLVEGTADPVERRFESSSSEHFFGDFSPSSSFDKLTSDLQNSLRFRFSCDRFFFSFCWRKSIGSSQEKKFWKISLFCFSGRSIDSQLQQPLTNPGASFLVPLSSEMREAEVASIDRLSWLTWSLIHDRWSGGPSFDRTSLL